MSSSRHEDYLLRQVKAVGVMLARILGLRTSGRSDEAAAELEQAYGLLLGPQTELLRRVDAATAATLLGAPDRILALARLFNEEAAQHAGAERGRELRQHAAQLAIEVAQRHGVTDAIREFLAELAPEIDRRELTAPKRAVFEACLGGPGAAEG